jgi:transaldolase
MINSKNLNNTKIELYADGADKEGILDLYSRPYIKGITTNPTLMRKAGIRDYEKFSRDLLEQIKDKPLSLEVFTDDLVEMRRQATKICSWGENVFVKIPITNSKGDSCLTLINELSADGIKINVTALLTVEQVKGVAEALHEKVSAVVSIFAGRIADTGIDPVPVMLESKAILNQQPRAKLLWASTREVLNIFHAESGGCDIITVPHELLKKAATTLGADLKTLSLETVKMFTKDAAECGYTL